MKNNTKQNRFAIIIGGLMMMVMAFGLMLNNPNLVARADNVLSDYWITEFCYVENIFMGSPTRFGENMNVNAYGITIDKVEDEYFLNILETATIPSALLFTLKAPNGQVQNVGWFNHVAIENNFLIDGDFSFYQTSSLQVGVMNALAPQTIRLNDYFTINQKGIYSFYFVIAGGTNLMAFDSTFFSNIVEFDTQNYVPLPPDPVKTGYDFIGWYYDENFTQPYAGAPITDTTSLYAKFTPTPYAITYNLDGGSLTGQMTSYTIESANYTLPIPTKNYYDFGGWYTASDFTGSAVTSIPKGSTGAKTFYAKFTSTNYTITYELNGGSMTGQATSYNYETETITLPTPTKTGYNFEGWYASSNFSGASVSSIPKNSNGNKSLYAKFTPIAYSISYALNGGELTGQKTEYIIEDSAYTLPTPTRVGHTFKGWFIDGGFTGSAVTSIPSGSTGEKVFFAKWEIIVYTVKFYVDGEVYKELAVAHGLTLGSYVFASPEMVGVSLYANAEQTAEYDKASAVYEDIVLYASTNFELYCYLTLSINGIKTRDLLAYNSQLNNLYAIEMAGYSFGGWYYDEEFTKAVNSADRLTSDTTIFAKLTEIQQPTFMQRLGSWFSSTAGILTVIGLSTLALGGIGYAVRRKKTAL